MLAMCKLVESFPLEPTLALAWVRSVLPLARDVESTVHDTLVEWVGALLFDKVALAAGLHKPGDAGSKAREAAVDANTLLAGMYVVGRAASTCLGKVCGMLHAKKKLEGGKMARGLEVLLAGGGRLLGGDGY
jgi:condensin-2 complex subunit D3